MEQNDLMSSLKRIAQQNTAAFTTLPYSDQRLVIDASKRKIIIPPGMNFVAVQFDHNASTLYFEIDRYIEGVDLTDHTCLIQYVGRDVRGRINEGFYHVLEMDVSSVSGKIVFGWPIRNTVSRCAGEIQFSVRFYSINDEDEFTYNLNTTPAQSTVKSTIEIHNTPDKVYPTEFEMLVESVDDLSKQIESVKPVKGVDYWTEQDRDEVVDEVSYLVLEQVKNFTFHICSQSEVSASGVPVIAEPDSRVVYLVSSGNESPDLFDEWIYVDGVWEKFGSARIDMSDYVLKSEMDAEVRDSVTNNALSLTDEEQQSAKEWLGTVDKWRLIADVTTEDEQQVLEFSDLNLRRVQIFIMCPMHTAKQPLYMRLDFSMLDNAYFNISPEVTHSSYEINKAIYIETEPFLRITGESGIYRLSSQARNVFQYPNNSIPFGSQFGNVTHINLSTDNTFPTGSTFLIYGCK